MRVLLDTNALLWMLGPSTRLGPLSHEIIDSASAVIVADATLWEIAIKVSIGKLAIERGFAAAVRQFGFERPATSDRYFETLADLPLYHRDPFDRMLVAHALTDDLAIVTADPVLAKYGVRVVDATA